MKLSKNLLPQRHRGTEKNKIILSVSVALCSIFFLTACNAPSAQPTPTLDSIIILTNAALTVESKQAAAQANTTPQGPTPTTVPTTQPTQIPTISPSDTLAEPPTPSLPLPTIDPADAIPHLTPGQDVIITYIDMKTQTNGWAGGGNQDPGDHILITNDGGLTWQDITPPEPTANDKIAHAFFLDTNTAWITYSYESFSNIPDPAIVWHTTDAGGTWTAQGPLDTRGTAEFYFPSFFTFADAQNGWFLVSVGAGMSHDYTAAYRTQDGGQSWIRIHDPSHSAYLQSCCKTGLTFADANLGILTAEQGPHVNPYYLVSQDGGLTWEQFTLPSPIDQPFMDLDYYCKSHSPTLFSTTEWRLGYSCRGYGGKDPLHYEYRTDDGGTTWSFEPYPGGDLLWLNSASGFALSREIYFTPADSLDWQPAKLVNWDGQFDFINETHGWAVARTYKNEIALVYTEDGGTTWQIIEPVIIP